MSNSNLVIFLAVVVFVLAFNWNKLNPPNEPRNDGNFANGHKNPDHSQQLNACVIACSAASK